MLKMLGTLAIFFLCLGLFILLLIWAFTYSVLFFERMVSLIKDMRIERMDSYINRKFARLNGCLIYERIKSLWSLKGIYLVPGPIPIKVIVMNRAFVSSHLINNKLNKM